MVAPPSPHVRTPNRSPVPSPTGQQPAARRERVAPGRPVIIQRDAQSIRHAGIPERFNLPSECWFG